MADSSSSLYVWGPSNKKKNQSFLLPKSMRALIVGRSGSGKTTLINFLLLEPGIMDYDTLHVCSRSLHQPTYIAMKQCLEKGLSKQQIKYLFEKQNEVEASGGLLSVLNDYKEPVKPGAINAFFSEKSDDIPDPIEFDKNKKNVILFDDLLLDKQNPIEAYFVRGRHSSLDCIYVSQSYFSLPRQTIRMNANFFVLFKQCRKNLIHIYHDLVSLDDISFEEFVTFCSNVWDEKRHGFIVIDLTRDADSGRYRCGLDRFWLPRYDKLIEGDDV